MSVRSEAVVRSLGILFHEGTHCGLSDSELLERFLARPDETAAHAFEGLVLRHGPMVLDVCNKVLGDPHDAQDAFQATFLVLATRARSIRRQKSVGSWLHGVALRVARRARSDAARRKAHERRIAEMTRHEVAAEAEGDARDFRALHEEVERLPRSYREPVVLCYFEGLTLEAAAGQLGCPASTLGVRLMRARQRLKDRLGRRGISRADGLLLAAPAAGPGSAGLPGSLVQAAVDSALRVAAGGAVPPAAAQLMAGASRSMPLVRITQVVGAILVATMGAAALAAGFGLPGPRAAGKPANRPASQVPDSWIGKKAVIKYSAPLMDGDQVVGDNVFRVYAIDRIDGDRLQLAADGIVGWIKAEDVVLLDQAIDFYTKVIEGNEKHVAARVKRAQVRDYLGDTVRAIAELTEAIKIGPPNVVVYGIRGDLFMSQGEYDKAIADLTRALQMTPWAVAYLNRAHCWSMKQEHDKAIADYTEAIRLDPQYGLSYFNRGLAWSRKEDRDRAIADYTEAIRLNPIGPHGESLLASAYNMRGRARQEKGEPDAAIADLNEAIRLDRNDASAYHNRGLAWSDKHEYDRAIDDYNETIRLGLGASYVYHNRGLAWSDKHEYDRAIDDFTEAIRLDPKDAASYTERGRARDGKQEYDRAIDDFNEAIRINPKTSDAYYYRGIIRLDRGQYIEAIADFSEAIRLDPTVAASYSRRAAARLWKGELDKAIDDYDQAIRLDPRNMEDRVRRGWAWARKKEYDKALADFNEVVRLEPKYPDGHVARAWLWAACLDARYRDGKKAVESATRACELTDWKDESFLDTLAAACAEAGDFDSAVKWQTRSISLTSDAETKRDAEARLELYRQKKPYHAQLP